MTRKLPKRSRTFADAMRESAADTGDGLVWQGGILEHHSLRRSRGGLHKAVAVEEQTPEEVIRGTLERLYKAREKVGDNLATELGLGLIFLLLFSVGNSETWEQSGVWLLVTSIMGALVVIILVVSWLQARYRSYLANRLQRYQFPALLVPDESGDHHERLAAAVPWYLRLNIPRRRDAHKLEKCTQLIAENVDWFLGESEHLVRLDWYKPLLLVPIYGAAAYCLFNLERVSQVVPADNAMLDPMTIILIVATFIYTNISRIGRQYRNVRLEVYREFMVGWLDGLEEARDRKRKS